MVDRLSPLHALTGEQQAASEPEALAFVSASAGTGKTQVLTARVMRLLLHDADPASILCLTFTKAGAAEMADRIHARLAHWVRLKDADLAAELRALGEDFAPGDVAEARTLFAKVLDARGGGLRIQTIHAFAQSLLAAFPIEADIVPGFRPLEGREEVALARETLASMLVAAEERGDDALIADVQSLSERLGEDGAEGFLVRCAHAPEAIDSLGPSELIEDRLREALDVPLGDLDSQLAEWASDDNFDLAALRAFAEVNLLWGTKTGGARAEKVENWIAASVGERVSSLVALRSAWITQAGTLQKQGWEKLCDTDQDYPHIVNGLEEAVGSLLSLATKAEFASFAAAALRSGQAYARDYGETKRRAGVLDFGDLIRLSGQLLAQPGIGEWVRFKLDQGIDHILVDEAQDTNSDQWLIVEKLAEEFFETEPDGDAANSRTIFAVGDFKQAIFGFQGTSPHEFSAARRRFAGHIAERQRLLRDLSLDKSYRSTPPILELVDAVMEDVGAQHVGLEDELRRHSSAREGLPGRVTLLRPVSGVEEHDQAEEDWLGDATLLLARKIAQQVKTWIDEPMILEAQGRALRPEDVLILVRSRGELASLIVARLHEEGVPVAGVDRLLLTDPLAIQDLLAALRFAIQPHDDLNFASLLVSPLFGWTQDELYELAKDREASLWNVLRDRKEQRPDTLSALNEVLNQTDLVTPYLMLESILSGSIDGRRKILARLGQEACDPIEELLNAALRFEAENPPSLQHFLHWFDSGTSEIKRDPSAPLDAVRVMTVHGAKGLQAPLVILADATFDPDLKRGGAIDLPLGSQGPVVPLPRPRKEEQLDMLAAAIERQQREEREEHWRLMYVAMTRAEEQLVVGGALGPRARNGPPEESWYAAIERGMMRFDADWLDDPLWSGVRHFQGTARAKKVARRKNDAGVRNEQLSVPEWAHQKAPEEERPPRPLAPSALLADDGGEPPPSAEMQEAAERGRLLHRLFERLPDVAPAERRTAALNWLETSAGISERSVRESLADDALRVIETPEYCEIFSNEALAEAPIAAIVDDVVVSGIVDRLLVTEDRVQIVDFKTGRFVPEGTDGIPAAHIRQMAAYAAALAIIFPNRSVEAALLYTEAPKLHSLPTAILERHKPRFADTQESLSPFG